MSDVSNFALCTQKVKMHSIIYVAVVTTSRFTASTKSQPCFKTGANQYCAVEIKSLANFYLLCNIRYHKSKYFSTPFAISFYYVPPNHMYRSMVVCPTCLINRSTQNTNRSLHCNQNKNKTRCCVTNVVNNHFGRL